VESFAEHEIAAPSACTSGDYTAAPFEELETGLALTVSAIVVNGQLLVTGDIIAIDHIGTNTVVNGRSFADAAITAGIEGPIHTAGSGRLGRSLEG
jgi:hypothetical protein